MEFKDQIKLLADRVNKMKDNIHTEEATKNALIMPFIQTRELFTGSILI